MCRACAAVEANVDYWKQRAAARSALWGEERRTAEQERQRLEAEATEEAVIDDILAQVEQDVRDGVQATVTADESSPPAVATPVPQARTETGPTPSAAAAPPASQPPAAVSASGFLTIHDERKLLGKPLWTEVKDTIPP